MVKKGQVKAVIKSTVEKIKGEEKTYKKLRIYNAFMGALHLISGTLMVVLSNNFSLPITTSYLNFDRATLSLFPVRAEIFDVPFGIAVACFLFLSALAHFLTATVLNNWYVKNLKNHINKIRWIEYSFSSSLMIVLIAMLNGVYDLSTLVLMVGCNAGMILFGWMMELHNQTTQKTNWTAFVMGCILGIIPWIVIVLHLVGSANLTDNAIPTFVYWIIFSIFLFFNVFAINQALQYGKVGKWKNYLYGEAAYILLSLIAKSLLAWQIFAGTLRPM